MKNKSVKTMVASVLAVGLMMSIPASAFAVSPGGMSVPSAQSVDSSENCAQILDWLGIQIPRHFDSQAPYKINTLSESDPNYWQAEWEPRFTTTRWSATIPPCTPKTPGMRPRAQAPS